MTRGQDATKLPIVQSSRDDWCQLGLVLKACTTTALLAAALAFASCARNLTGTYIADDGGVYYVQQSGSTLWWAGLSLDPQLPLERVWHRGLDFTNVFRGTINSDNTIVGEWSDVSRGLTLNSGTLTVKIGSSGGVTRLTKLTATGGFGATTWTKSDPLDDTKFNGSTLDIISRFDAVHKNDGSTIHDNLKPYRDATVFYGHVVTPHLEYLHDNPYDVEAEAPHVNYGEDFRPPIPNGGKDSDGKQITYHNFGLEDRDFKTFACYLQDDHENLDADLDIRLKIDLDKLEPDFYTTGWGDRTLGPKVFSLKLNDSTTQQTLGYALSEAYMATEAIMLGKAGTCDSLKDGTYRFASLLPGWADLFSASVLVNGRPINGNLASPSPQPTDPCKFIQPCPRFDPLGIQIGNLSVIDGAYVRITGALVLDCGHGFGHPCFDDHPDDDFFKTKIKAHQNQEIHPIYSIDIINSPFRPDDILMDARKNLTGTWGGSDGSTYYVRQIGSTIWWLGQMRDRQPMQRGTNFPAIGALQLKSAFDAGDPPCPSQQCWAFATVFKGTITESPIQTVIDGDWAGVPQSTSAGSSGGHMKFFVFNHKIIVGATPSIFPVTIEKMYEPEDTTPPVITINEPAATQYPHNATLTLNYSVTDGTESGVQSFAPLMDNAITVGNHGLQSGQAIKLLTEMNFGQHTFTVTAIDNAGNEDSSSVTFTIVVTPDSIEDDVNQFVATGAIRNHGLANSLLAKLNAAASARAAGDCATANNDYQAFIKELQTQIGRGVEATAAAIMIGSKLSLIKRTQKPILELQIRCSIAMSHGRRMRQLFTFRRFARPRWRRCCPL